jgi:predicted GIY-YIG superfamily endonuclease
MVDISLPLMLIVIVIIAWYVRAKPPVENEHSGSGTETVEPTNLVLEMTPQELFDERGRSWGTAGAAEQTFQGVYVIRNKSKNTQYTGQSQDVRGRVKAHFSGRGDGKIYAEYKNGDFFTIKMIEWANSGYRSLSDLEKAAASGDHHFERRETRPTAETPTYNKPITATQELPRQSTDERTNIILEMTPQEFFDKRNSSNNTPEYNFQGVYVIHNTTKNLHYIGQSQKVRDRVNAHFTGRGNPKLYTEYTSGDRFTIKMIELANSGYRSLSDLEKAAGSGDDSFRGRAERTTIEEPVYARPVKAPEEIMQPKPVEPVYCRPAEYDRTETAEPTNSRHVMSPQDFFAMRNQPGARSSPQHNFAGVYVLYNITKNIHYAGQSRNVPGKVSAHLSGTGNRKLYADYKHGDKFSIKMVALANSGYKSLNDLEKATVSAYSSFPNRYNKRGRS